MATYVFKTSAGIEEHEFSMHEAPKYDVPIRLPSGRIGRRVFNRITPPKVFDHTHTSNALHRDNNWSDPERCLKGPDGKRLYPRVDGQGRPVFANDREIREHAAKTCRIYD